MINQYGNQGGYGSPQGGQPSPQQMEMMRKRRQMMMMRRRQQQMAQSRQPRSLQNMGRFGGQGNPTPGVAPGAYNPPQRPQPNVSPQPFIPPATTNPVAPQQQLQYTANDPGPVGAGGGVPPSPQMNGGGQDLPPMDRNPYSPTGGQGMNLQNMMRRNRPNYY